MKITPRTVQLLKNFSGINTSIYVNRGNKIRTMSESKSIVAEATIEEEFPREFGIYDLNQFLGVISLFSNPEFEFDTQYVTVKGDEGSSSRYFFSAKENHVMPPDTVRMPDPVFTFTLTDKLLKQLLQASNVMGLPDIVIEGDGEKVTVTATNTKNNTTNNYFVKIADTDTVFKIVFKVDNIKLMSNTYEVKIASQGIAEFALSDGSLKYWVPGVTQ